MTDTVVSYFSAQPLTSTRSVKVFFGDQIRRFGFGGNSFNQLHKDLVEMTGLDITAVKYQDDEGDWVTISTDAELTHAFDQSTGALRLKVETREKSSFSVPAPVAPLTPIAPSAQSTDTVPLLKLAPPVKFVHPMVAVQERMQQYAEFRREGPRKHCCKERPPHPMHAVHERMEEQTLRRQQWWEAKRAAKEQMMEERKGEKEAWRAARQAMKEARRAEKGEKQLSGRFVKHVTVEDNQEFAPGTAFVKTWRFRNDGALPWPENSVLLFVGRVHGDQMGGPDSVPVGKIVNPGEEIDISAQLIAPSASGAYNGFWRLADATGKKFGQRVRVQIKVVDGSSSSSSDENKPNWSAMLAQLEDMGFKDKGRNVRLLVKFKGDIHKVIARLINREMKLAGTKSVTKA